MRCSYPCYNIVYASHIIIDSLDALSIMGVKAEFTVTADSVCGPDLSRPHVPYSQAYINV